MLYGGVDVVVSGLKRLRKGKDIILPYMHNLVLNYFNLSIYIFLYCLIYD